MEEKKQNSILNKRASSRAQENTEGVQTEVLQPATVKIPAPVASTLTNPYSVLIEDYSETLTKTSSVNFVLDAAEVAKSVVKLPEVESAEVAALEVEVEKPVKKEQPDKKEPSKPKLVDMPEIPKEPVKSKVSDFEMLNNMPVIEPVKPKEEKRFEVPDDVKFTKVEEEKSSDIEMLNNQEVVEPEKDKQDKPANIEAELNDLEALLAELDNDEGNSGGTIGLG